MALDMNRQSGCHRSTFVSWSLALSSHLDRMDRRTDARLRSLVVVGALNCRLEVILSLIFDGFILIIVDNSIDCSIWLNWRNFFSVIFIHRLSTGSISMVESLVVASFEETLSFIRSSFELTFHSAIAFENIVFFTNINHILQKVYILQLASSVNHDMMLVDIPQWS